MNSYMLLVFFVFFAKNLRTKTLADKLDYLTLIKRSMLSDHREVGTLQKVLNSLRCRQVSAFGILNQNKRAVPWEISR